MHTTTAPHNLDALVHHAQALTRAYHGIAHLVAMPSYNPPRTVVETRFAFLPNRADSFVVQQQTTQDTPISWDNGASRSAHHRLAVTQAKNAWNSDHPMLVGHLTEAIHGLVSTACGAPTAQPAQRHVEGAIVIRIDAQGAEAMVFARPWNTSVYKTQRGDDTDRLHLPAEAPHLATLLHGARRMAMCPTNEKATPSWTIRATLSGIDRKGKQTTIETCQESHSPQDALMAMALAGHSSLVVPERVAALAIHRKIDLPDHQRFVQDLAHSFA